MERDHNDFYSNLEHAQRGEEDVAMLMQRKFKDFKLVDFNNDKACDLIADVGGREVTIEIKEDFRAADTGNVIIEYSSRGKPSAIMTTTADFWVFRLHCEDASIRHLLFKTSTVKQMIRDRRFTQKRQYTHTDSCNGVYFFKVETLDEYCDMVLN